MGFDSVSLSTRTGLGSIYNQWKYAISNKKTTDNFKTYLLSSQEHLNQLEGLFTDYGHVDKSYGDTFVRESIVELKDGRLLCMDPNEAKAYILDLNDVNSSSEKYNLTVIKPEDESVSFAEQITNLISKITAQLGADGVTTTKDGTKIDSSMITGLLSGDTKTQYCDEMGVANTSETDNTYTSGALKLVAAKGITDITTSEDEIGYYSAAFKALGVEIEPDGTTFTSGGKSVISRLNLTIRDISKIIEKGTTATDQDKLNILEIVRKMTTLEYELLERFNPGFTQALNTFVGDFQSRTYKDKNGNQTGADETISYQTVMQEKLNDMSNARSYLSSSDQTAIDKYIGCYIENSTIYIKKDNDYLLYDNTKPETHPQNPTLITKSNVNKYTEQLSSINQSSNRYESAKQACESSSKSKAYNAMYNAISQTVTLGVSESTIQGYIDDITKINATNRPDELLTTFLDISNTKDGPEIIARLLENSSMVDKLKQACASKSDKPNILDSQTGKAKTGNLYNLDGQIDKREYNVNNILNHLEYLTKSYYATKSDSTSAVNSSKASNAVGDSRYVAKEGANDGITSASEANKTTENLMAVGGAVGGIASVASVGLGIKTATAIKAAGKAGIMYSKGWGFAHTTETATKTAAKLAKAGKAAKAAKIVKAAHWATGLQCTGIAAGAVLGAVGGVWLANNDINKNIDTFTKPDGTFNNKKANGCKIIAGVSGAGVGGFAAAALLGVTPIGWGLGIAAAIGAVGFGLYQVAKKWWWN